MSTLVNEGQAIPAALRARPQWVLWKGKKVPYQTNGDPADTTDRFTWNTFENVYAEYCLGQYPGIGYVFSKDDPYTGIDVDKCRDAVTGELSELAEDTLTLVYSYAEVSPSETGIHVIAEAEHIAEFKNKSGPIECYDKDRYFTFTGNHIAGTPLDVLPCHGGVTVWLETHMPKRTPVDALNVLPEDAPHNVVPFTHTDDERLDVALRDPKFASLFRGEIDTYPSQSEADGGLACKIAFYWQNDPLAIDRIFRRSALYRGKWERATYREPTIQSAIRRTPVTYTPPQAYDRSIVTIGGKRTLIEASPHEPVMPFPVDALPSVFTDMAEAGAKSKGSPPDFFALPLLVAAAAAIGPSFQLQLKSDFILKGNLWGAVVGVPGSGKSPAIDQSVDALQDIQAEKFVTFLEKQAAFEKDSKGANSKTPPKLESVITTDATLEALIDALHVRNGLLLKFDELNGWIGSMNQYKGSKGNDREQMLSMWSGAMIAKSRIGYHRMVRSPHLSIIGGIQPERLHVLQTDGDDGLFGRFLWAYPESQALDWDEAEIPKAVTVAVAATLKRLVDGSQSNTTTVRLSPDARAIWVDWYNNNAAEQRSEHIPPKLRGTWSKLATQAGRIALVLHAVDDGTYILTADTMQRAITLTDYFAHQARRVHREVSLTNEPIMLKVLGAIQQHGKVSKKVLLHEVLNRNVPATKLDEALATLQTYGIVTCETESTGGRPASVWRLA